MIAWVIGAALIYLVFFRAPTPTPTAPTTSPSSALPLTGNFITNTGDPTNLNPTIYLISNQSEQTIEMQTRVYRIKDSGGNDDTQGTRLGLIDSSETSGVSIGDTLNVFCGNDTDNRYYCMPNKNYKVVSGNPNVRLDAWAIQQAAVLDTQVWDPATNAELTAATNLTSQDYNLSVGASESKQLSFRVLNNGDNGIYRLAGLCYAFTENDLVSFGELTEMTTLPWQSTHNGQSTPRGSTLTWDKEVKPANVTSIVIDNFANSPKYVGCYVRPEPLLLPKFSWFELSGRLTASSTDPTSAITNVASDGLAVMWIDSSYTPCAGKRIGSTTSVCTRSSDTIEMVDSPFSQDQLENVRPGMDEPLTSPAGGDISAVIGTR